MLARAVTHALVGLEPRRVDVEAHVRDGLPGFAIVGLADKACQEARERVRSGIASAELDFPAGRITVNLAPAELRKEGSGFDLPIALAVLAASKQVPRAELDRHAAVGELALDGTLRRVGGVLAVAEGARRMGLARLLCPPESAAEAALAGVEPVPIRHLADAVAYLRGELEPDRGARVPLAPGARMSELSLAAFASETGTHLVRPPGSARWREHERRFDERAYRAGLAAAGFRFLGRSEQDFPLLLRSIHDPPPGLFLRGDADPALLARPAVAVVGARACSGYGAAVSRALGRELAAAGLVVVSGLARGIDAEAHRGALEAGGATVAVLGCGIDRDYPAAHAELARRIAATGLLVAEYAPGVEPAPWRFPARNRIVAGLCAATVVVEARERSGALITVDLALEEGREVFAVPGEITSALSDGTNALLKLGATPLTSPADVLATFGFEPTSNPEPAADGPTGTVFALLRDAAASADELTRSSGLAAGDVSRALVELELAGFVSVADGLYRAAT